MNGRDRYTDEWDQGPPRGGPYYRSYPRTTWNAYPALLLATRITAMAGLMIAFVGVIGIGGTIGSIMDSWMRDPFGSIGAFTAIIGVGGIVFGVSHLMRGIADFLKGKKDLAGM